MTSRPFVLTLVYFLLTVVLLCLPGSAIPQRSWLTLIHADKIVHIGMFALLCILFAASMRKAERTAREQKKYILLVFIACVTYGILMEFVQKYWIPNRSFEVYDICADTVGSLLGLWYAWRKLGKG